MNQDPRLRRQALLKVMAPRGMPAPYANTFREMLAKGADGHPLLPPAFFHRGEGGATLQGKPDIRTVGGKGWVGILSQGGTNPYFDAAVGVASRVLAAHYGLPVALQVAAPFFGVKPDFDTGSSMTPPRGYFVRDLAIKRRSRVRRDADDAELIKKVLMQDIQEIADRFGFDLPSEKALGLRLHDLRCIGLRLSTTDGPTNEYVTLANAEFSINADLAGVWQAGSLQSRGYGRIVPRIAGMAMKTSAPKGLLT